MLGEATYIGLCPKVLCLLNSGPFHDSKPRDALKQCAEIGPILINQVQSSWHDKILLSSAGCCIFGSEGGGLTQGLVDMQAFKKRGEVHLRLSLFVVQDIKLIHLISNQF